MTGLTTAPAAGQGLERAAYLSILAFAASLQVSIAAANICLGLTAILWLSLVVSRRERIEVPDFFWWLAAYAGWTLVAALFSIDPATSFRDSKQLLLFAVVPIAYRLLRGDRSLVAVDVIISVAALSAAIGIVQFGILKWNEIGQRPQGALGMYMTYSGQLMLVACVVVARILFWPRDRAWPLLVLPALLAALIVTLSRNAWVGAGAGIGLLLLFRDFRLLGLLPVALAILVAVAPPHITERITATFRLQDPTQQTDTVTATLHSDQDRIAMAKSGIRMIKDRPITGVGPDMVMELYPVYRDKTAVNQLAVHLHNVPLQIAAERGLPALALWLGFIAVLVRRFFRRHAVPAWTFLANAGLACVAAMIAAGMFEYNFGDSEFLMLFLLLVTLPSAAARGEAAQA